LLENIKNNNIRNSLKIKEYSDTKVCWMKASLWTIKFTLKNIDISKYTKFYLLGVNSSNYFWNPWTKDSIDLAFIKKESDLKKLPKLFYLKEIKKYKKETWEVKKYKCKWEIFDYYPKCFPSSEIKQSIDVINFTGNEDDISHKILWDQNTNKADIKFMLLWVDKNDNVIVLSYYSYSYNIYKNPTYKVVNRILTICKRQNQ